MLLVILSVLTIAIYVNKNQQNKRFLDSYHSQIAEFGTYKGEL